MSSSVIISADRVSLEWINLAEFQLKHDIAMHILDPNLHDLHLGLIPPVSLNSGLYTLRISEGLNFWCYVALSALLEI